MKMKTIIKLALGGSVLLASVAANAANQLQLPASTTSIGNSNLLFYVADLSAKTTYTVDLTGQSVQGGTVSVAGTNTSTTSVFTNAQALSSSTQGVVNTINGDAGFSYNFTGDTALLNYISNATNAGDTVEWGVVGEGYLSSSRDAQGNSLVVTTGAAGSITNVSDAGLTGTVTGKLNTDYSSLNTNFAGTTNDHFAGSPGTSKGVFGTSTSPTALTLYGQNLPTGQTIGSTAVELYGLTGNGTASQTAIAFGLGQISFNGTALSFTGNTPTVPIPGAVWLFGSGVLGLLGIGRRRERTGAVAA